MVTLISILKSVSHSDLPKEVKEEVKAELRSYEGAIRDYITTEAHTAPEVDNADYLTNNIMQIVAPILDKYSLDGSMLREGIYSQFKKE